jgi:hypothetical protein
MLIEFSIANFRSIRERQTFSLVASADSEHESRNAIALKDEGLSLLRSAAIYGPNASGKSNLLRGLATLRQLVESTATKVQEGQHLNVTPFLLSAKAAAKPSEFDIVFVADDGVRYHYMCAVGADRVYKEWLVAYPNGRPQRWFEREYDAKTRAYDWWFGPNFKGERAERKVWQEFTRSNALFFSTAIQLNNDQLKPAFAWMTGKLIVLAAGVNWNRFLSLELLRQDTGKAQLMSYMRAADIGIDRLELLEEDLPVTDLRGVSPRGIRNFGPPPNAKRVQVRAWHKQVDSNEDVALDIQDESDGTRKLFEFAGGWIRALQWGATLFVDELDRSLHPHITRFLVDLFHGSTNKNNAQLVFTTHDTTLLDTQLLRRDQVWFIEKDETHSSKLFSLLEYRPRKDEALERGYLKGRYGAVPLIGSLRN